MCKWYSEEWETCCNADCPYCTDYCPVAEHQEVCRHNAPKEMPWADEIAAEKERSKWWK